MAAPEVDHRLLCDESIPRCESLAKEKKLSEALDILMNLEKQTRTGGDTYSNLRVVLAITRLCFESENWPLLHEHIMLLSKRRSQIKLSVSRMVQECCGYIDQLPTKEEKLQLIQVLRNVTAGKIYVEVERARLTHKLALMKEAEGDVAGAASILQELQVETFGSMEKKEKVELILEQMRLCLARKDYVRTQIISKKINTKFFEDTDTEELKLRYYHLMIQLDQHEGSYLAISNHYRAIFNSNIVKEDVEQSRTVMKCVVLYCILAPYNNEQSDLIHRIKSEKILEDIPIYKSLLSLFITMELIQWTSLVSLYEQPLIHGTTDNPPTTVFEAGSPRWQHLKSRVVEHNIRIMAKYYTRISLARMADLLDLSESETEEFLSGLVVNKTVVARADRLSHIVSFIQQREPSQVLNDWSYKMNHLMDLLSKTTHLINKEEMIHKHLLHVAD